MKSIICALGMTARGHVLSYLVKKFMATTRNFTYPFPEGNDPTKLIPHLSKDHELKILFIRAPKI
jgi:hypothetical protein